MANESMFGVLGQATELRQRIIFTLIALIVYRLGTYIPVPGINAIALSEKYGVLSEEASGLMEDCEKISKLRNQCSDDKWDDLSISIINIQNHMFYSRKKRQNEFDLISKHSYNHSLITKSNFSNLKVDIMHALLNHFLFQQ